MGPRASWSSQLRLRHELVRQRVRFIQLLALATAACFLLDWSGLLLDSWSLRDAFLWMLLDSLIMPAAGYRLYVWWRRFIADL
jgi:hypothetical protein